ncbi:protein L-Myc-like [Pteronotus mesoamericanus]|uniref:protein L-Myc-like n=1 Tax=Pteronotus mesoamericanus TaxID=1884717 RepID=UPI0023EC145A|nr:protein L-Myc-like [Pteronotus parnellii mesoamericanus]
MILDLPVTGVPQPVFSAVSPHTLPATHVTSQHPTVGLQLEPGPRNWNQALTKSPDANQTSNFLLVNHPQVLSNHSSAQYVSSAQNAAGTAQLLSSSIEGHSGAHQPSQKIHSVSQPYPVAHHESITPGSSVPQSQIMHFKKPCFQASVQQQSLILQPKIMASPQKNVQQDCILWESEAHASRRQPKGGTENVIQRPGVGPLPVAGGRCEGEDVEFNSYQHYFYDYDCGEDFYRSRLPSEDIWKKFELVPSPPTLPSWGAGPCARDLAPGIGSTELWPGGGTGDEAESRGHSKVWGRNYASIIRRDCMWSGFSALERLERVVSNRLTTGVPRGNPSKVPGIPDCTPSHEVGNPVPTALCPLGEPKTQACSGSESPSDLEGEGNDVVTMKQKQPLDVRKPVTIMVQADPLDPCMRHFHISVHQQQHNYAARLPPESCSDGGAPKRGPQEEALERDDPEEKEDEVLEEVVSPLAIESDAPQSCHPKPLNSDTEDVTKREKHNLLERKRRNDLRWRFLALRNQIPALASCSKAPKVVILRKALEYVQALVGAEKRLATEKRQLRSRQQQLQKRIAYLSSY